MVVASGGCRCLDVFAVLVHLCARPKLVAVSRVLAAGGRMWNTPLPSLRLPRGFKVSLGSNACFPLSPGILVLTGSPSFDGAVLGGGRDPKNTCTTSGTSQPRLQTGSFHELCETFSRCVGKRSSIANAAPLYSETSRDHENAGQSLKRGMIAPGVTGLPRSGCKHLRNTPVQQPISRTFFFMLE